MIHVHKMGRFVFVEFCKIDFDSTIQIIITNCRPVLQNYTQSTFSRADMYCSLHVIKEIPSSNQRGVEVPWCNVTYSSIILM